MNDHDIDQLLRRKPPTIDPPASLEAKVRARIRSEVRPSPSVRWPWIAAPIAAALILIAVLRPGDEPAAAAPIAQTPDVPEQAQPAPTEDLPLVARNPLSTEARALRRDAERTGRFLVNCLPSLTQAE